MSAEIESDDSTNGERNRVLHKSSSGSCKLEARKYLSHYGAGGGGRGFIIAGKGEMLRRSRCRNSYE